MEQARRYSGPAPSHGCAPQLQVNAWTFSGAAAGFGRFGMAIGLDPGNRLGDVSHAVQKRVESEGLSVVRSLVGHGIGRSMHEDPQVPNYGEPGRGPKLEEGMVLAVEPMVNAGRHGVRMGDDGWAIYSQDGSLAAHFEFTIAVTADGPRILTPWHEDVPAAGAAN
jgi:methionyl aminopeptidase